jgi:Leucine-rich repeat (LRR) protein
LYSNSAEIPSTIGNLTKLTHFYIDYSLKLGGSLPASFGNLTLLEYFKISRTGISGEIPEELGDLPVLEYFYLKSQSSDKLSGKIPSFVSSALTTCTIIPVNSDICRDESFTACGTDIAGIKPKC